jgi:hypothetical protein
MCDVTYCIIRELDLRCRFLKVFLRQPNIGKDTLSCKAAFFRPIAILVDVVRIVLCGPHIQLANVENLKDIEHFIIQ